MGMDVFKTIPKDVPVVVAEAVWQYSHHVLAGLRDHRAPILTVANWSGEWPGLVGMLNLNGSLTKAGVPYSTLWSEDFSDNFFLDGLRTWLESGRRQARPEPRSPLLSRHSRRHRSYRTSWGSLETTKLSSACSTRAVWACITPSSTTSY